MTRIIFAALLCSVAWPAEAGPVLGFVQGVAATLTGSAVIGGTIGTAGFLTGVSAGALIGSTLVGRLALSFALQAVAARLNRPRLPPPADRLVNFAQPRAFMERSYGTVRKGGPIGFTGFVDSERFIVVLLAAHPIDAILETWLDTRLVTLDAGGEVETDPMVTYGNIKYYLGAPGQVADADLVAAFTEITSGYDFEGLSYARMICRRAGENFPEVYPGGREWQLAPVFRGQTQIYDPRSDSTGWTDNCALIFAHECLHFGKTVDWDEVAAQADICDQIVTNAEGVTQKRWTANLTLDDGVPWETVRDTLMTACDGWTYQRPDGAVGFRVGAYAAPVLTLTDRDFLSLEISDQAYGPDEAGEFVVTYIEPSRGWVEAPSGAVVLAEGKPRVELECYAINSHNQAARVAKRLGKVARARFALRASLKLIGYEVIGHRFIRVTHAGLGVDAVFEVDRLSRDAGAISFSLDAHSVEAADFAFDSATEEPERPVNVAADSDDTVPPVVGLTGAVVVGTGGVAQIDWTWPAQDASLIQQLRIRSLDGGVTEWQTVTIAAGQTSFVSTGLVDGATYDAEIRNRTNSARVSAWSATVSVVAVADTVPPADLTEVGVSIVGGQPRVTFGTPNDPRYAAARIWRGTTTTFGAAALIATEYGPPNTVDFWGQTGLAPGSYYYWAAPINGSGVAGTVAGPFAITVT